MSDATEQIELISRAASSKADRALFIADPEEYADSLGVKLDKGFGSHMRDRFIEIEGQMASQGYRNEVLEELKIPIKDPGWIDPVPEDFRVGGGIEGVPGGPAQAATVVAVAAVVSAAAAVVSAASTTYMATNWLSAQAGRDIELGPSRFTGVRDFVVRNEFLRPDMRVISRTLKTRK